MAFSTSCSSTSLINLEQDAIIVSTKKAENNRFCERLQAIRADEKIERVITANNLLVALVYRYQYPENSYQLELYKIRSNQSLTKCASLPLESAQIVVYDFNGNQVVLFNYHQYFRGQYIIYDLSRNNFRVKAKSEILSTWNILEMHWLPDGNHFYAITSYGTWLGTLINSLITLRTILNNPVFLPPLGPAVFPLGEIICRTDYNRFELYDPYAPVPEWRVVSDRPSENCKLYKIDEKSFYLPERKMSEIDHHFNAELMVIFMSIIGLNNLPVVLLNIICSYISLDRAQPIPSCLSHTFCFFKPKRQIGVLSGEIVKKLNLLEDKLNNTIRKLNSKPKEGTEEKERIAQIELKTKILLVASEFKELLKNRMDMSYHEILKRVSDTRNGFLLSKDGDEDLVDLEQIINQLYNFLDPPDSSYSLRL